MVRRISVSYGTGEGRSFDTRVSPQMASNWKDTFPFIVVPNPVMWANVKVGPVEVASLVRARGFPEFANAFGISRVGTCPSRCEAPDWLI